MYMINIFYMNIELYYAARYHTFVISFIFITAAEYGTSQKHAALA